jgi:hypothetical protein
MGLKWARPCRLHLDYGRGLTLPTLMAAAGRWFKTTPLSQASPGQRRKVEWCRSTAICAHRRCQRPFHDWAVSQVHHIASTDAYIAPTMSD